MYHNEKTDAAFPELRAQRELERPTRWRPDPLRSFLWVPIFLSTVAVGVAVFTILIAAILELVGMVVAAMS